MAGQRLINLKVTARADLARRRLTPETVHDRMLTTLNTIQSEMHGGASGLHVLSRERKKISLLRKVQAFHTTIAFEQRVNRKEIDR